MASKPSIVPFANSAQAPVQPHEVDLRLAEAEQHFVEAAQQAAPLAWQLQLAREIVALRMHRRAGEAGVIETAALTETVVEEMAKTGLYAQVIIDGLRGKVDDAVVAKIAEVQSAFLEGASLIHAVATGAVFERVQQFKAPACHVRFRDVAYSVLADKLPPKLGAGGR
jgi:hypothetical protein